MARTPLSGFQHALRAGDVEAVISGVGASLRTLRHRGRDLVVPFDADEVRPHHQGATLAPWPNRIVDGTYTFGGVTRTLALSEPVRGHAIHGLVSWLDFQAVTRDTDEVVLEGTVEPQSGYPWRVVVRTTFTLDEAGLTQAVTATNESETAAPWGTAAHPYLIAGPGRVDDWTLELPAAQVLQVTPDRLIPTDLAPVEKADPARFDFRTPRAIGDAHIDHAFTGLTRDADGDVIVRVTDATGSGVALIMDAACGWVQAFTADIPGSPIDRAALAVEPMTCAPDAFNAASHPYDSGLVVLEPGASHTARWRIQAIEGA